MFTYAHNNLIGKLVSSGSHDWFAVWHGFHLAYQCHIIMKAGSHGKFLQTPVMILIYSLQKYYSNPIIMIISLVRTLMIFSQLYPCWNIIFPFPAGIYEPVESLRANYRYGLKPYWLGVWSSLPGLFWYDIQLNIYLYSTLATNIIITVIKCLVPSGKYPKPEVSSQSVQTGASL